MIVLGIDPGFAAMGWAIISVSQKGASLVYSSCGAGVIRTKKSTQKIPVYQDNQDRCEVLVRELEAVISSAPPIDIVAIEAESWTRTHSDKLLGMARGILYSMRYARLLSIPIVQIRPQEVRKRLLGKKSASKTDLQEWLTNNVEGWRNERLPKGQRGHAADAAGCAITEALMGTTSRYILSAEARP